MIRYLFILFLSLIPFYSSNAGIWGSIAKCLKNPCDCGCSKVNEEWGDGRPYSINKAYDAYCVCPPYNKKGRSGCLKQFSYDDIVKNVGYYTSYCAEETSNSGYFNPKIRVRMQTCNFFACWQYSKELNWNGQCVTWVSGWVFPTIRFCARIAVPAQKDANNKITAPADHGYKEKKHLDSIGYEEEDKKIETVDGEPIDVDLPKLCVYRDPGIIQLLQGEIDLLDWNPVKQVFHKSSGIHPLVEMIISIIELHQFLSTLSLRIFAFVLPSGNATNWIKEVLKILIKIQTIMGDVYIVILKEFGQLNRLVEDNNQDNHIKERHKYSGLGCVNIPVGPLPPPYYFIMRPPLPTLKVNQICPMDKDGKIWPIVNEKKEVVYNESVPIDGNGCVASNEVNNVIHNAVRVGFDKLVPLCSILENGEVYTSGRCVDIDNISSSIAHKAGDMIPLSFVKIKECTSTSKPNFCNKQSIRVVYGTKSKGENSVIYNETYDPEIVNCDESPAADICQTIWGVNTGDFKDLVVDFNGQVENEYNLVSQNSSSSNLVDNNKTYSVFAKITRKDEEIELDKNTYSQDPENICVYETSQNILVGCVPRGMAPKPSVSSCDQDPKCIENTPMTPKMRVKIAITEEESPNRTYFTEGIVGVLNYYDNKSNTQSPDESKYKLNLAGFDYDTMVTDENFVQLPFNQDKGEPNVSTKYGVYKDNIYPYNPDGTENPDAVYLYGLEYMNGQYVSGGTYICLKDIKMDNCQQDTKICVLTKLVDEEGNPCVEETVTEHKCRVSVLPKDRIIPNIDSLTPYLKDNEYFDNKQMVENGYCQLVKENTDPATETMNPVAKYNTKKCVSRDKTPIELNLCTKVTSSECKAITEYNAQWPNTEVGKEATGTCIKNPSMSMRRKCIFDRDSNKAVFEKIDPEKGKISSYANLNQYSVSVTNNGNRLDRFLLSNGNITHFIPKDSIKHALNDRSSKIGSGIEFYLPPNTRFKTLSITTSINVKFEVSIYNYPNYFKYFDDNHYNDPQDYIEIGGTPSLIFLYATNKIDINSYIIGGTNVIGVSFNPLDLPTDEDVIITMSYSTSAIGCE